MAKILQSIAVLMCVIIFFINLIFIGDGLTYALTIVLAIFIRFPLQFLSIIGGLIIGTKIGGNR